MEPLEEESSSDMEIEGRVEEPLAPPKPLLASAELTPLVHYEGLDTEELLQRTRNIANGM
jgi:hypothetical protein